MTGNHFQPPKAPSWALWVTFDAPTDNQTQWAEIWARFWYIKPFHFPRPIFCRDEKFVGDFSHDEKFLTRRNFFSEFSPRRKFQFQFSSWPKSHFQFSPWRKFHFQFSWWQKFLFQFWSRQFFLYFWRKQNFINSAWVFSDNRKIKTSVESPLQMWLI